MSKEKSFQLLLEGWQGSSILDRGRNVIPPARNGERESSGKWFWASLWWYHEASLTSGSQTGGDVDCHQMMRWWALFVTYTIIQSIIRSEMCSLHSTHPSAHRPGAVGSRHCSARGAVGGLVPCSRVSPQSWTLPARAKIRTHNLGLPRVSSPTLYPLGHDCPVHQRVEVGGCWACGCSICKHRCFELDASCNREPVQGDKERCNMGSFWLIEDQSCRCILNHL